MKKSAVILSLPNKSENIVLPGTDSGSDTRRDRGIALLLFVVVFTVYASTLCRTIYTGDDGDFITAMATFGVPHPTGYPLFCLLGRLFLRIVFWGTPAYKINLMTALFGAASISFLYRFLAVSHAPRGHRYLAAMSALLFAFSPTFWQQSLSCEVYSLTALFLTVLLFLAVRWQQNPHSNRALLTLTFTFGLALTNHLTVALLLPAFLAFVLYYRPALFGREWKLLPLMVAVFVLPLSFYLYLPLAAHNTSAPVNWGLPGTLQGFWLHVTGDAFRGSLFQSTAVAGRQWREYLGLLQSEYGIPLLLLASVGIFSLGRRVASRALLGLLLWIGGVTVFFAVNYDIFDIYVYYIPSYLIIACLIGFGSSALVTAIQDWRRVTAESRARLTPLMATVALFVPLTYLSLHFSEADKSHNYLEEDYAVNVLRSAPPGALIVTNNDVCFTLWYHRFVLGERTDIVPIHQGLMRAMLAWNGWYAKHLYRMYPEITGGIEGVPAPLLNERLRSGDYLVRVMRQAEKKGVPVLIVPDARYDRLAVPGFHPAFDTQLRDAGFIRVPWGICDRLYRKGQEPSPSQLFAINREMRTTFQMRGIYDGSGIAFADPLQIHIPRRYLDVDAALATLAEHEKRYDIAIEALERARKIDDWPELQQAEGRCQAKQTLKDRENSR